MAIGTVLFPITQALQQELQVLGIAVNVPDDVEAGE